MTPRTDPVGRFRDLARAVTPSQRSLERFAIALLFATMLVRLALIWNEWGFEDVGAYLGAAHRLRDGASLFDGSIDPDSYRVFRYAPWFAWLWVPLSYLPTALVTWGWGLVLAAAAGAILLRLVQLRQPAAWALIFLMAPWLVSLVQVGNIQPLVVAALAFGISRRSGPLWIGLAASLKGVPLLFGLIYVARREWMRVGLALAATGVLLVPFLLYDLSGYPDRSRPVLLPLLLRLSAGVGRRGNRVNFDRAGACSASLAVHICGLRGGGDAPCSSHARHVRHLSPHRSVERRDGQDQWRCRQGLSVPPGSSRSPLLHSGRCC